jgi:cytochrome c oxidase subunit 2
MMNFPLRPPAASQYASDHDLLFFAILGLTVFFTFLVAGLIAFLAFRYRRGSKVDRTGAVETDHRLELMWTVIPLMLALGVFIWAAKLFTVAYNPPPDAKEIFVIGKQWMWHTQHMNGIRENNELHVPAGEPVKLTMISQDVIHSFFVPAFRIKRDVMPGIPTSIWFTPTRPGKYYLFCTEYCGTQHSEMTGWVTVMEPADFAQWYATRDKATPSPEVSPAQAAVSSPVTMEAAGRELYEQLACGSCHDPGGMNRGPSLAGLYGSRVPLENGRTVIADHAYLRQSILYPSDKIAERYQQIMPSYKDQLTEDQVNQLIVYIRSLGGNQTPGGQPEGVEAAVTGQPKGVRPANAAGRAAAVPGGQPANRGNQNTTVTGGGSATQGRPMQGPTGSPEAQTEDDNRSIGNP